MTDGELAGLQLWLDKVERRLERLWCLVNGNGEVGVFEAIRDMQQSQERTQATLLVLDAKVDTLARREDLNRLRCEFNGHVQTESVVLTAAMMVRRMKPVWRWLVALVASALGGLGVGAWLR